MGKGNDKLTLKEIIRLEPRVAVLLKAARRRTPYCDVCRMGMHRRPNDPPGFKQEIAELVGLRVEITDDRLRTSEAYETVFAAIWRSLPIIKECAFCGVIDDEIEDAPLSRTYRHLRALVWDNSGGRCYHCNSVLHPIRDFEVDHLVPRALGGDNEITNLVASCRTCNRSKGARRLEDWRP